MPLSKKFCLFRKLVKNAKWWSKSNLPLSHSPDRKIFPFKKSFKKSNTLVMHDNGPYHNSNFKYFIVKYWHHIMWPSRYFWVPHHPPSCPFFIDSWQNSSSEPDRNSSSSNNSSSVLKNLQTPKFYPKITFQIIGADSQTTGPLLIIGHCMYIH